MVALGPKPRQYTSSAKALNHASLSQQPEASVCSKPLRSSPSHSGPKRTSLFMFTWPCTASTQSVVCRPKRGSKCRTPDPTPDLLNLKPHFNNIPRGFLCISKLEKCCLCDWASLLTLTSSPTNLPLSHSAPALLASLYFSRIPHTMPPQCLCTCYVFCL